MFYQLKAGNLSITMKGSADELIKFNQAPDYDDIKNSTSSGVSRQDAIDIAKKEALKSTKKFEQEIIKGLKDPLDKYQHLDD